MKKNNTAGAVIANIIIAYMIVILLSIANILSVKIVGTIFCLCFSAINPNFMGIVLYALISVIEIVVAFLSIRRKEE